MTYAILGKDETGRTIQIDQGARREGMYIIGATGTGKSTLIQSLVLQDIEQGLGVTLLDPHGDLTNRILESMTSRIEDVIFLDVANDQFPFGLNLFSCPYPNDIRWVQYTVNQVMHIFDRLYDITRATPNMSYFLRNCAYTIIANPGYTMAEIPLLLTNELLRRKLLANVTDSQVLNFWTNYDRTTKSAYQFQQTILPILNKLDEFLQPMLRNIVGQSTSTIDLRKIMDERKLLFVKLDPRLEDMTTLIGSVIIAQVLNAAYSRAELLQNRRRQMNLYCDEFEWFAGEDFMQLVSEARKFGIGTTVSNQTLSQIPDPIKENILQAATLVVFRVSGQDGEELATEFDAVPPPAETRREAVVAYKHDVVGHLLHQGHSDPAVKTFINDYLRKIDRASRVPPDPYNDRDSGGLIGLKVTFPAPPILDRGSYPDYQHKYRESTQTYHYKHTDLQEVLEDINDVLYDEMIGKDIFLEELVQGRDFELVNSPVYYTMIGLLERFLGYARYWGFYFGLNESERQHLLAYLQKDDELEKYSLTLKGNWDDPHYTSLLFTRDELRPMASAGRDKLGLISIALLTMEGERCKHFMASLKAAAKALAKSPIQTTDSGRFEDKPLAPRTIADVEKEVAKFLSSPLKLHNLTAYVKTPTGEHKVSISRSTAGMSRAAFNQRLNTIYLNNYTDKYVRPVAEVTKEISERQTLPAPQPPKPLYQNPEQPARFSRRETVERIPHDMPMHDRAPVPTPQPTRPVDQPERTRTRIITGKLTLPSDMPAVPAPPPQSPPLPPSRRRKSK